MVGKDETEVNLWQSGGGWEFETFCSCEIGNFCHHAAALLTKAAKERDPSRLQGRGVAGAVAAALPSARELMKDPPPDLPRLRMDPRFELRVNREPVDKVTRLLLQSLGQPNVEFWISAEASVVYGPHRSALRSSSPEWVSSITHEGQAAILQHDAAAENAATQQLRDTGLSSLQSNSAWKFLLNLKSRETQPIKGPRPLVSRSRAGADRRVLAPVPRGNGQQVRRAWLGGGGVGQRRPPRPRGGSGEVGQLAGCGRRRLVQSVRRLRCRRAAL